MIIQFILKRSYKEKIKKVITSWVICWGFVCGGMAYSAEAVLKVGIVPQFEQRQLFRNWKPILTELEKLTNLKFELIGSSRIPVFEKEFNKGNYDMAYMNPYHALKAYDSQNYIPLVRDNRNLKGILVVNKNSGVKSIQQLANKTIAFPSANALGASLIIRSVLSEKYGIKFTPRYVQTHSSVYLHIAKNLVAAGGGVDRTFSRQPKMLKDELNIIYKSPEIVSHPIVIHPRVNNKTREIIRAALLKLFNTKKGKVLFENVPMKNMVTTRIEDYKSIKNFNIDEYIEE